MQARSPKLTVLLAAGYLLTITASALYHDHHHGKNQLRPGVCASHSAICQFLAQKPAPAAIVTPVGLIAPVHEVVAAGPACAVRGVFAAWYSRAPPIAA